jgi:menaquinone-dependent protoporphyrinogen oxidase
MRVLVSVASKHGATAELADRLGQALDTELRARRVESVVDVVAPEQVTEVTEYDAAVLGSAVYVGHWLDAARQLAQNPELRGMPVWLFSSGPVGDPLKPAEDPTDVATLMDATGARGHRVFGGRLMRSDLGFAERAVVRALRVPEGDFRDWDALAEWAADIAGILTTDAGTRAGRDDDTGRTASS